MKLVGATNLSIQIPFFLEGITQGFLASLLSLGILYVGFKLLIYKITIDYSLYLGYVDIIFLPQKLFAALILLGIALGIFGCVFSMGRFLKV
jgi:cell division transport system permease protein